MEGGAESNSMVLSLLISADSLENKGGSKKFRNMIGTTYLRYQYNINLIQVRSCLLLEDEETSGNNTIFIERDEYGPETDAINVRVVSGRIFKTSI